MNIQTVHGNELQTTMAAPYQTGKASYYGGKYDRSAGRKTKSGEIFNPRLLTAAHNRLPMGTIVEVRCIKTSQSVLVKINDTGRFGRYSRVIDLSEEAAKRIGITHENGIEPVEIYVKHNMRF